MGTDGSGGRKGPKGRTGPGYGSLEALPGQYRATSVRMAISGTDAGIIGYGEAGLPSAAAGPAT